MKSRVRVGLVACLLFLGWTVPAAPAEADGETVVWVDPGWDYTVHLSRAVRTALQGDPRFELRRRPLLPRNPNYRALSNRHGIDYFIRIGADERRGRWVAVLEVVPGQNPGASERVSFRARRLDLVVQLIRRDGLQRLGPRLPPVEGAGAGPRAEARAPAEPDTAPPAAETSSPIEDAGDDAADDAPETTGARPERSVGSSADNSVAAGHASDRADPADAIPSADEGPHEGADTPSSEPGGSPAPLLGEPPPWAGGAWLTFRFSAGSLARQVQANVITQGVAQTRSFEGGLLGHLELGGEARIYPGAAIEGRPLGWLGLAVRYHAGLGVVTVGCGRDTVGPGCPDDALVEVPSGQENVEGGLLARLPVGPLLGELELGAGSFYFGVDSDQAYALQEDASIPAFTYRYAQASLDLRLTLLDGLLGVGAGGSFLYGLDVGDRARYRWGADSTFDWGWKARLGARHHAVYANEGLFVDVHGEVLDFLTTFAGEPGCVDDGCEPVRVGPISDIYIRLGAAVGISL